jgi:hypothetical protein
VTINVYLTAHFVYFARPQMLRWSPKKLFRRNVEIDAGHGSSGRQPSSTSRRRDTTLKALARRTLKGMCVMLLATILNLAILFHMRGREQYWMCFMFCTMDGEDFHACIPENPILKDLTCLVAVGIVTLHWITSDPTEMRLGRSESEKRVNPSRYSSGPPPRALHALADSVSLADVTSPATCDTRAWADEGDTCVVPNKILVTTTTSYSVCTIYYCSG